MPGPWNYSEHSYKNGIFRIAGKVGQTIEELLVEFYKRHPDLKISAFQTFPSKHHPDRPVATVIADPLQ